MADELQMRVEELEARVRAKFDELKQTVGPQVSAALKDLEAQANTAVAEVKARLEAWRAARQEESPEVPAVGDPPGPATGDEPAVELPEPGPSEQEQIDGLRNELDGLRDAVDEGLEDVRADLEASAQAKVDEVRTSLLAAIADVEARIADNLPAVEEAA